MGLIVENCVFERQKIYFGKGGVIMHSGDNFLYIKWSVFVKCMSSDNGGAIYSFRSRVEVNKVCSSHCLSESFGHFSYLDSKNVLLKLVSISKSGNSSDGISSIRLCDYNNSIHSSNVSTNHAEYIPTVYVDFIGSCVFEFVLFGHNMANNDCLIQVYSTQTVYLDFCCFVKNQCNKNTRGIVLDSQATLTNCVFIENNNTLFVIGIGFTVGISDSYIYHEYSVFLGTHHENNVQYILTNPHQITFFQTVYCHAEIPYTPAQTQYPTITMSPYETLFPTESPIPKATPMNTETNLVVSESNSSSVVVMIVIFSGLILICLLSMMAGIMIKLVKQIPPSSDSPETILSSQKMETKQNSFTIKHINSESHIIF